MDGYTRSPSSRAASRSFDRSGSPAVHRGRGLRTDGGNRSRPTSIAPMHAETAFVVVYSAVLLAVAAGLHRLGKIVRNPANRRASLNHNRVDDDADRQPGNPR